MGGGALLPQRREEKGRARSLCRWPLAGPSAMAPPPPSPLTPALDQLNLVPGHPLPEPVQRCIPAQREQSLKVGVTHSAVCKSQGYCTCLRMASVVGRQRCVHSWPGPHLHCCCAPGLLGRMSAECALPNQIQGAQKGRALLPPAPGKEQAKEGKKCRV